MDGLDIRPFADGDEAAVVALWQGAFPDRRPWSTPAAYLARKRRTQAELLLVGVHDAGLVGAVAAGYDGVRGWLYHLAVDPAVRRRGIGAALVRAAEQRLAALGCPKVNLQVMPHNDAVVSFYERLGYAVEPRISMGRALG
jgi:ribosomal protein S18 acetylase RimI-like enzyme